MDPSNNSLRRSEDIALDLLKFLAPHTNISRGSAGSTGFVPPSGSKSEDQIAQLLELYARCRQAVESPVAAKK